jgi:hypothetical protein
MGRGRFLILAAVVLALAVTGIAQASRNPTNKEHRAIGKALGWPPRCAAVSISTVTAKPKWASVSWRPGGPKCKPFAANGVAVFKKKGKPRRWRFVTAGSSFDCGPLYTQVPLAVVQDLGITCI